jgi:HD-like signal output (HDOD) protein/signal transduction histidine kinase
MSQSKPNIIDDLKVNRLPSLPNVLVEMLRACEDNQASFQELSQIISRDSVIAGRVIFLANSSFYNPGSKITTLERALFLLGTDTLKTIVITASIQQFFSAFKSAHSEFLLAFWQRSLSCALLAKSLAILTSYPNPDEVYLTGLLHNIGELVLDSNHPGLYNNTNNAPISSLSDQEQLAIERQHFSFTHAQVGACLAKEWGLSQFTCDAIEFHHADKGLIEDAHHLVKLIYLASFLSHPQKQYLEAHDDIAPQLFELNAALINEIVIKIESEVTEISRSLGLNFNQARQTQSKKEAVKDNQETAQLALAKQVRNISLIQNAMGELNRADNKAELENALQNSITWLYGLENSAIFWYASETNELIFNHPDSSNSLPIKFKLEENRSLLAKSAINQTIINSIDESTELHIVDEQLINTLKTSGFLCIPVQDKDSLICVIAAGFNDSIKDQTHFSQFLSFFAHETAPICRRALTNILVKESLEHKTELVIADQKLDERLQEVIHEANNPLNIISNYLHSLGQRLKNKDDFNSNEISKELNIVREEVQRTSQILLQLKDLKQEAIITQPSVDMNSEIQSLCTIYKTSLFLIKSITYKLNLDPKLDRTNLNRNAFKQILTNLIRNASEALPKFGVITINTNARVNVNGQDFVELCIKDNGPGIPDGILKEIFKPVVSTKGNEHSGLGLSITKNLVKDAKGTISCRSSANGTMFQILLPKEP